MGAKAQMVRVYSVKHAETKLAKRGDYEIRVSPKAKHVCIKVSHLCKVEVVVPRGFDQRKVPEILQRRQDWIAKTIQRIEAERQSLRLEPAGVLPKTLLLRSLPEDWAITYRSSNDAQVRLIALPDRQLTLQGPTEDIESCKRLLLRWLGRKATSHLSAWLRQVSQETELPFTNVSVRGQKTRWASCSSKKSISLNYKLLFLPPHLVRYVLIHELCHTIHLNHSANFWGLVGEKEPGYQDMDRELRTAWRYVPEWVEWERE